MGARKQSSSIKVYNKMENKLIWSERNDTDISNKMMKMLPVSEFNINYMLHNDRIHLLY